MRTRGEPRANRQVPEPLGRFVHFVTIANFVTDRFHCRATLLGHLPGTFECSPQIQAPSGPFFGGK